MTLMTVNGNEPPIRLTIPSAIVLANRRLAMEGGHIHLDEMDDIWIIA
ncbi:MAG: hypothetical protein FWD57_17080 [Polyangiaceae bacterium]|nr:hypothetical protein [Polyangiaceae bacterium]